MDVFKNKFRPIKDYINTSLHEIEYIWRSPEVEFNYYIVFLGYLSLAVKGLGYLILTWTTVVLLGGFVSMLRVKDFWSLTVITLVQTVGVLDAVMNERLSNIVYSFIGLVVSTLPPSQWKCYNNFGLSGERMRQHGIMLFFVGLIAGLVQILIILLVLCPIGAAYKYRMIISTGLSIWRLIQHDYMDTLDTDPNKKNLKPALNVLYSLVLLQGGLFLYRAIYSIRGKLIANAMAKEYRVDLEAFKGYFSETRICVEKDPSLARDWNPVTYTVGLLESKSPQEYCSGAKLLSSLIRSYQSTMMGQSSGGGEIGRMALMKQLLLGSLFTGHAVQRLLWTLDSAEPYGTHARVHAADIVKFLASMLRLEQFPGGLHHIVSLLDPQNGYPELHLKGLQILGALAANKVNREAMCGTPSLFPEMMGLVDAQRHTDDNDQNEHLKWEEVEQEALALLLNLMTPLELEEWRTRLQLPQGMNMASSTRAMESIINCDRCSEDLKVSAWDIRHYLRA